MKIKVRYFAAIREATGKAEETLETRAPTARALYRELALKYERLVREELVTASVDRVLVGLDAPIEDGAEVVFIPPVAGG